MWIFLENLRGSFGENFYTHLNKDPQYNLDNIGTVNFANMQKAAILH